MLRTRDLVTRTSALWLTIVMTACATGDAGSETSGTSEARSMAPEGVADLVLRGGKIATLAEGVPETSALAARAGRITALGTDEEIAAWIGEETRVVDLNGRLAIPGFIEGHGHFLSLIHI